MTQEYLGKQDGEIGDEEIIRFTQRTRKAFVDEITKGGFPEDPKEQRVLLTALSDMDRTALGNKRLNVEEKQTAVDAQVATMVSKITSQFGGRNPFEGATSGDLPKIDEKALPEPDPVPGEKDIGLSEDSYEDLMRRHDGEE